VTVALALFTRDLRVHDNPVLYAAAQSADCVVPLFVLDERILASSYNRPNRARFLADSLADLHTGLRESGAALVVRRGDVTFEVARLAQEMDAGEVHVAADVSGYAQTRQDNLSDALGRRKLVTHDSVTIVAPGSITPNGKDHFAVFTPYLRQWEKQSRPAPLAPPATLRLPSRVWCGVVPRQAEICAGPTSPDLPPGGETQARLRMQAWLDEGVQRYGELHDDLAADGTSRLSPYLHFGCLSATELAVRTAKCGGAVRPRSSASWPGETSTIRSWPHVQSPPTRTTALETTVGCRISRRWTRGEQAVRVIPWSTPACASCSARATCTTGPG
jgi:deoxyribodipyrimidine photo-lyase